MGKLRKIKEKLFLVKGRDIASLFLLLPAVPIAIALKKTMKKPIWLVLERSDEARDNGRAFFEYLMACRRKEVTPVYAIHKKSADYKTLQKYGKHVIEFGSFRHIVYYLACEANISSVKNMGPNDLMGYVFRRLNWMNDKMFFLQHGITVNHPDWLEYSDTKFRMVLCGAKPEYDYIRKSFGYPKGHAAYAGGMCRYDFLQHVMQKKESEENRIKQVLILPSWRTWLKPGDPAMREVEHTDDIEQTEYFRIWMHFLSSPELERLAELYQLKFIFYPHPTMQKYISEFQTSELKKGGKDKESAVTIADAEHWNLNLLIAESDLLVTDYSSVFMDFVYMKKPVIFYQFDLKKFRAYHYQEGYFSYEKNPFGRSFQKEEQVLQEVERIAGNSFQVSENFLAAWQKYFPVWDDRNCERVWRIIRDCVKR